MSIKNTRYSFGADEHIFVELSEEMSFSAFFKAIAITNNLAARGIFGITEICPANASYLVKFDPDIINPHNLLHLLQQIEQEEISSNKYLNTRIIEIPVYYNDPWTHETLMRFRDRHQDPSLTDLEYSARINGYSSIDEFIDAHSGNPWLVTMVGFVAGLPFLFQMVERERQIQTPKYLRPRTDTPKLTIGHGGCFGAIYPVRGAGGYQMFGITPAPIFDPDQNLPYLRDFMCFFKQGDIVKYRKINRLEYENMVNQVENGSFNLRIRPVTFSLEEFLNNPSSYNRQLEEILYEN